MTQAEFDKRLDDPLWGIASPIPTIIVFGGFLILWALVALLG